MNLFWSIYLDGCLQYFQFCYLEDQVLCDCGFHNSFLFQEKMQLYSLCSICSMKTKFCKYIKFLNLSFWNSLYIGIAGSWCFLKVFFLGVLFLSIWIYFNDDKSCWSQNWHAYIKYEPKNGRYFIFKTSSLKLYLS